MRSSFSALPVPLVSLVLLAGASSAAPFPPNVAAGANVTADSVLRPEFSPDHVVDGVVGNESRWVSTDSPGPHRLTLEFAAPAEIGVIHLFTGWNPDGVWGHAVRDFRFRARRDGVWEDVPGASRSGNGEPALALHLEVPVRCDALELVCADDGYVRVVEVRAYAPGAAAYPELLPPAEPAVTSGDLCVSGIYPHLAAFSRNGECGIGAVVPWAGRLWMITYPPHAIRGSSDKLYEIRPDMTRITRPESVGGTHASRLIHRESDQLIIGPYFIRSDGTVRAADVSRLTGRMTATARHLRDPENRVYFFDMEGAVYEVDVHSLDVVRLFAKPVPGWHGKGGYTGQGRLIISNNGERPGGGPQLSDLLAGGPPAGPEDAGVLAEWDGAEWRIVERRQFTDVTGPGGILGAPDDTAPVWAMGWDKRSVILMLLDSGTWHRYRVPKASYSFDPKHGWYTEWPRIREIGDGRYLMVMHGGMYDFPGGFRAGNTGGIRPLSRHLRYIPDFCRWNDRVVLASDDTSIMQNPLAGQSQSNLWFGTAAELETFGTPSGFGGPWVNDRVEAGVPSDPFLTAGYARRTLHLAHDADREVEFVLEADARGTGEWQALRRVAVPAAGYVPVALDGDVAPGWLRVTADRSCTATAYLHQTAEPRHSGADRDLFAALADADDGTESRPALVRPAGHNRNLEVLVAPVGERPARRFEVDETLRFIPADDGARTEALARVAEVRVDFSVDESSVVFERDGIRYRLPKHPDHYGKPGRPQTVRGIRECESERYLVNAEGTFYELPRDDGMPRILPVSTHGKQISDFCTWRGLLVLAGCRPDARPDGQFFGTDDGFGLWFGSVDDLWRFGKPVGRGGPWRNAAVAAGTPSDPYLMTGYDRKRLRLAHDAAQSVAVVAEVDFLATGEWHEAARFDVPPGEGLAHRFRDGFGAHWIRFTADRDCVMTAELVYE